MNESLSSQIKKKLPHLQISIELSPITSMRSQLTLLRRRRKVSASSQLYDDLYAYAKKNLLWLNVYVKDSFSTHIVRDERQTRIR